MGHISKLVRYGLIAVALIVVAVVGTRTYQAIRDPNLAPWHRFVAEEAAPEEIDAMDWPAWMAREDAVFAEVAAEMADLPERYRGPENRYDPASRLNPANFPVDWNR